MIESESMSIPEFVHNPNMFVESNCVNNYCIKGLPEASCRDQNDFFFIDGQNVNNPHGTQSNGDSDIV